VKLCAATLISWLLFVCAAHAACLDDGEYFAPLYTDKALFSAAIEKAGAVQPSTVRLGGVTVPHHLLAGHLVAGGIRLASAHRYDRVILLSPDHFHRTKRPFATAAHGFDTVFGPVEADGEAISALMATTASVEESCLFEREHGVHALLPFVKHYLPGARIVPVAISIRSSRAEWEELVRALTPLMSENTLVLQSTDFSHYLPHHEARLRDQQTLNVLASGSLDGLAAMRQPDHMDSMGAMYVQMALQARVNHAAPDVLANENSAQYVDRFVAETTSYMVIRFGGEAAESQGMGRASWDYVFAGDTFFGRTMPGLLVDELAARRVEDAVLAETHGRPMIVNLEGVLLPDMPAGLEHMVLAIPSGLAADWLKRLNVVAVGLANNHAMDIGPSGYAETVTALKAAGIPYAGQGEAIDLPGLAVVALSDLDTNASRKTNLLTPELLDRLVLPDAWKPVVSFVHWGREYVGDPGLRERELAGEMRRRGVAAIIGAHPHVASEGIETLGGDTALVYSLGNFLFDQDGDKSSGALVHLRAFEQGTLFVRRQPLPNLFDLARGQQELPKAGSR